MKRVIGLAAILALCVLCLTAGQACAWAEGTEETIVYSRIYDYAVVQGITKLNMRLGPDARYDWVGAAKPGDWVGILGEQDNWCYAYIPELNQYGYMSKTYLLMNDETAVPAEGVVNNPQPGTLTALRSFPSYQAQALKTFENGTPMKLVSASSDGWYEVEIGEEKGYIRCETVRLTSASGAEMAVLRGVNEGVVEMRDKPYFLGSQVIGEFASGTQAAVLLKTPAENSFFKVVVNGTLGYVPSNNIIEENDKSTSYETNESAAVVLPENSAFLNLRDQPSDHARVLGRCQADKELKIVAQGEAWTKVYDEANDRVGYCQTKYLSSAQNPGANIRKIIKEDAELYMNLDQSKPGKHDVPLSKDAEVTVLVPGDVWCQVRCAGTVGFVRTECLQ